MSTTTSPDAGRRHARFPTFQWWIRDQGGRVVLAQPPNAAVLVWLACTVIRWSGLLDHRREPALSRAGQGALVVWGLDELVRGASPARRVLGGIVLVVTASRLFG